MINDLFNNYKQSVIELADKLPQWNSKDFGRKFNSAISSLFEEAGELSGLISKKRIRKDYWCVEPKTLPDFEEIKQKFTDEASDFLWVMTCSCYCLGHGDIDILSILKESEEEYSNYNIKFEQTLYDIFSSISTMNISNMFDDRSLETCLKDLVYSFGLFLAALYCEYDIKFEDMIKYNLDKLSNRYDTDGKRVDGK